MNIHDIVNCINGLIILSPLIKWWFKIVTKN